MDKNVVFLFFVLGIKLFFFFEWMVMLLLFIFVGLCVFFFVDDWWKNGGSWNEKIKFRVGLDFVILDLKLENKLVVNVYIFVFIEDVNVLLIWGIYKNDYFSYFFVVVL